MGTPHFCNFSCLVSYKVQSMLDTQQTSAGPQTHLVYLNGKTLSLREDVEVKVKLKKQVLNKRRIMGDVLED